MFRFSRPAAVQDAVMDPASGRQFASITRVEGAGHLVRIVRIIISRE
jgi:hypothetical protein